MENYESYETFATACKYVFAYVSYVNWYVTHSCAQELQMSREMASLCQR